MPLRRTHGGAEREAVKNPFTGTLIGTKLERCPTEKRLIAAYAVRYKICDGDQLLLDSGTQLGAFVKELVASGRPGLRVISQAAGFELDFLNYPGDYVQLGGVLDSRSAAFLDSKGLSTGTYFEQSTERFLDEFCRGKGKYKAIISGTAFTFEKGLMVNSSDIIRYKHMMLPRR